MEPVEWSQGLERGRYESGDQVPEDELLLQENSQRRRGNDKDSSSHRSMGGTVLGLMRSPGIFMCLHHHQAWDIGTMTPLHR